MVNSTITNLVLLPDYGQFNKPVAYRSLLLGMLVWKWWLYHVNHAQIDNLSRGSYRTMGGVGSIAYVQFGRRPFLALTVRPALSIFKLELREVL